MRIIVVLCVAAGLAACGKKAEAPAADPAAEALKAVERLSEMPDVSVDIRTTSGADLARHLVDKWMVYGITPENYAMAESLVIIDDLPQEAKAAGVKGAAGFHFQGAGPHLQNVTLAYAMFDNADQAATFLDNLSDSNADADGMISEKAYSLGAANGPQIDYRCAIVPESGNSIACYYQDFSGQVVTTILFTPGPEIDAASGPLHDPFLDAVEIALANEDVQTRVFAFAEASINYLEKVTN